MSHKYQLFLSSRICHFGAAIRPNIVVCAAIAQLILLTLQTTEDKIREKKEEESESNFKESLININNGYWFKDKLI